ncbi:helix-turn-helix transcriptional regulator [Cohnella silvisoli]|uniref:AraC family transcriptional regulator n=1 Tax=Cohnella silvisoli TaxID=2873699 RepID=A0ABV1KU61_9BACL|nr:AraC family transcriptional regulator [Cohnella silvisoli]MCD9023165.1 AraC family transcriptional regulator [Cohnella silvisoli]
MSEEIRWEKLNPLVSYANKLACSPGYTFGPRIVQDRQLIWVAEGSGEAMIQNRRYSVSSGDLFHYGPHVVHRFTADSTRPFVLCGLHFQTTGDMPEQGAPLYRYPIDVSEDYRLDYPNTLIIGQQPERLDLPEYMRFTGTKAERYFNHFAQSFQQSEPINHLLNRVNLIQLLVELHQLTRRQSEENSENGILLRVVQDHLKERAAKPYNRAWLREWTHYHENHASSLFQKQYGQSPHDYFLECKLDLAKSMLTQSGQPVSEIAERLAFGSIHYFSRLFKSRTGLSPLAYRQKSRLI